MPTFHLRSPDGRMIDVQAPDQGTAIHMAQQRFATLPAGQEPAPIGGPARVTPLATPQHHGGINWGDWGGSIIGGLAQGGNNVAAPVGGANDTVDRLADMAAHGAHDFGQMVGLVPQGQPYDPRQTAELVHTVRQPWEAAGNLAARTLAAGGNHDLAAVMMAMPHIHPRDVENATVSAVNSMAGPRAAAQVQAAEDYEPQTAGGRFLHRGSSMLPGALFPGSAPQRVLAVAAPTLGATVGGEGARLFGASPQAAANAELVAGLIAAGGGGLAHAPIENAVTNVSDMLAGPRTVPTSGNTADLITVLKGGARGAPGAEGPTFKRSDLRGAANVLAQHVARVSRANGEDWGAMSGRVAGMGDQGMLADALPDLARNVADRGSYGQQFLGGQLNNRQLGVFDPATGIYSEPSAAMRLDAARRAALGAPAGAFDTTEALTRAQQANAGPAYAAAYAHAPADLSNFAPFAGSPMWRDAYARARGISEKEFVDTPDGPQIQPLPEFSTSNNAFDWRTLDLMKQGMDDMVGEGKRTGIGANDQRATGGFRDAFRGALDELNPDYAAARAAFAGPAAVKDAIDFGRSGYTMDPAELRSGYTDLSPSERQGANVGFYQAGRDATLGRSQRLNAAEALGATNPDMMARNQALMGDNFGDWNTTLGNEGTFFSTRNRALGGSATSRNLLGSEDSADIEQIHPVEATGALIGALHGEPASMVETGGNAAKLFGLGKLFAPKPSQMTEGTADVLGTVLGTRGAFMDPQTAALIQGLMDSAKGTNYSAGLVRPAALLSAPKNQDQGGQSAP